MFSSLKTLFSGLFGAREAAAPETTSAEPVHYNGYTIRPTPLAAGGQFQTAGIIEKEFETGVKQHRFIRVDKHATREEAASFTIGKARQIIDEQGDRIFSD